MTEACALRFWFTDAQFIPAAAYIDDAQAVACGPIRGGGKWLNPRAPTSALTTLDRN